MGSKDDRHSFLHPFNRLLPRYLTFDVILNFNDDILLLYYFILRKKNRCNIYAWLRNKPRGRYFEITVLTIKPRKLRFRLHCYVYFSLMPALQFDVQVIKNFLHINM